MAYTTRQQLIDRILRFYYNNFPSDDSVISNNEVDLYITDAIAVVMNKQMQDAYEITGIMSVPEGYITTYKLTAPTLDDTTGFYSQTLPHPPIGKGESIVGVYFSGSKGKSKPVLHVKPEEMDYFNFMPMPPQAAFYWVENNTIYFHSNTDISHTTDKINVRMASVVQDSNSDTLNIPPDAVNLVFNTVINTMLQRKNINSDLSEDGIDN